MSLNLTKVDDNDHIIQLNGPITEPVTKETLIQTLNESFYWREACVISATLLPQIIGLDHEKLLHKGRLNTSIRTKRGLGANNKLLLKDEPGIGENKTTHYEKEKIESTASEKTAMVNKLQQIEEIVDHLKTFLENGQRARGKKEKEDLQTLYQLFYNSKTKNVTQQINTLKEICNNPKQILNRPTQDTKKRNNVEKIVQDIRNNYFLEIIEE